MVHTIASPAAWAGFIGFVLAMLALDLGVFHRKTHQVSFKEAGIWSAVWVSLALVFSLGLWWHDGATASLEFLTGYVIEKSLSVDNLFVFLMVFAAFQVPTVSQHRVLFWGILGALLMRAVMIFGGTALLHRFHWLIFVFGGFLLLTGVRLFIKRHEEDHPENNRFIRWLTHFIPTSPRHHENRFFVLEEGRRLATPLFIALLVIEVSDVLFAVDSIPAVFAVTTDPFLVFTSNIFAIMGLRSLYFLLAGLLSRLHYLKPALAAVLVFVGAKMVAAQWVKLHPAISLGVVALILGAGVVASLRHQRSSEKLAGSAGPQASPKPGEKQAPKVGSTDINSTDIGASALKS